MCAFLKTKKRVPDLPSLQKYSTYEYPKNHRIVHFKEVNFMVCELPRHKTVIKSASAE